MHDEIEVLLAILRIEEPPNEHVRSWMLERLVLIKNTLLSNNLSV
ncbi:hypothetical protein [Salinivibrio socompensis]|nr:hypothetical protein [Salinivibrio socompensis]